MPPELKKPISSLSEMTCENCVFGVTQKTKRTTISCRQIDSQYEKMEQDDYCSEGQWLFSAFLYACGSGDTKLFILGYEELYEEFAREAAK